MTKPTNGMVRWAAGLVVAALLAIAGAYLTGFVTLPTRVAVIEREHEILRGWLERIERKIDKLAEEWR